MLAIVLRTGTCNLQAALFKNNMETERHPGKFHDHVKQLEIPVYQGEDKKEKTTIYSPSLNPISIHDQHATSFTCGFCGSSPELGGRLLHISTLFQYGAHMELWVDEWLHVSHH